MSSVCLIDTSVFVEILNVPGMTHNHDNEVDPMSRPILTFFKEQCCRIVKSG